jgi:hypothetical protein
MGLRFLGVSSSARYCFICGFCSSVRDFASSFLQIPPHDGHPCSRLMLPATGRIADFHRMVTAYAGHTPRPKKWQDAIALGRQDAG